MEKQKKSIHVIIYRVTGKQLFFNVPDKVCEECDLSVGIIRSVVKELGVEGEAEIVVKPWLNNIISCLLWRSWHPPVVTINGKRFSQGIVPNRTQLLDTLKHETEVLKDK